MPSPIPVLVSPDTVNVPILLYHHIAAPAGQGQEYYVSPGAFQAQMELLKAWGYTTLTVSELAAAIRGQASLPERPIVITFDDGNRDVFEQAFPILQKLDYKAVMYVIVKSLGAEGAFSLEDLQEVAGAGWEIGSHSYTHSDLLNMEDLRKEICSSRRDLEKLSGLKVNSFSYPYGRADRYVTQYVRDCGYTSAVGLGPSIRQNAAGIYYLNRLTVLNSWTLDDFSAQLPWKTP